MLRLPALALLGAVALAAPGQAQNTWRCADPDCTLIEPAWDARPSVPPTSSWEPRHEPWLTPQWQAAPARPAPIVTRREWLSQHDPRAWYGERPQAWHAEDDRRHGRWRGHGLFD
jgi:hypothetical protein